MTRYHVEFVPAKDVFGADMKIGIKLADEAPIVVPEDCPPCPECPECPPECAVVCWGWSIVAHQAVGTGGYPYTDVELSDRNSAGFPLVKAYNSTNFNVGGNEEIKSPLAYLGKGYGFTLSIFGNFCGHKIRYVVTPGTWVANTIRYVSLAGHGMAAVQIIWTSNAFDFGAGGTVKAQIDLTDAADGAETWTDLCGIIRIIQGGI